MHAFYLVVAFFAVTGLVFASPVAFQKMIG
jgi:hypothetical protein